MSASISIGATGRCSMSAPALRSKRCGGCGLGGSPTCFPTTPSSAAMKRRSSNNGASVPASLSAAAPTSATTAATAWFHSRWQIAEFPSAMALQWRSLCALSVEEQQEGQDGRRHTQGRGRTGSPGSTFGGSRCDYGQRSAAAQPGRFENLGPHSQEQLAKPAKQTGNHG